MPLKCPHCTLTSPTVGELAAHLIDRHEFRGVAAMLEARKVREGLSATGAVTSPPAPPKEASMPTPVNPCRYCQSKDHFPSHCPERPKKGTAPAGGGVAKATKPAKAPQPTHKKRKVKTRALASPNGTSPLVERLRELVAAIDAGRQAELELAEVRKLVGA